MCLAVIGNAMDEIYRDSEFRQFRESLFADDGDDLEVDQAVTAFDTPTAARTVVTRTVDTWRQCAGENLVISYDSNRQPSIFALGNPSVVDDIDVTNEQTPTSPQHGSRRAILAVDNLVVDVRITGTNLTDGQVAQVAKAIAGRNAVWRRENPQRTAPLITGWVIMPFSTPHMVAMVRYSPVSITCSSANRNDSAKPDPLATGQP